MNDSKEKAIEEFTERFKDHLNSRVQKNPYVIVYVHKGEFYGYHLSTLCQVTQDIMSAKRYTGDPVEQIQTIRGNLESVLNSPNLPEDSLAKVFGFPVYKQHWKDVVIEDIFIDFEYLGEVEPQTFTIKRVQ